MGKSNSNMDTKRERGIGIVMKEQKVVVKMGYANAESILNDIIKDHNEQGWYLTQIMAHASNQSMWTLLFEREIKDNVL